MTIQPVSKWSVAVHGSAPFTREELDEYLAERIAEYDRKWNNATTGDMRMYYLGQREAFGRCRLMVRAGTPFLP
jgi:hypothetical protein